MDALQQWEYCDLLADGTITYYGGSEGEHRVDAKSKGWLTNEAEHQKKRAASLGSEGWELVNVVYEQGWRTFYFKRPYE